MCPKRFARRRRLRTPMTIRRVSGARVLIRVIRGSENPLAAGSENLGELLRWNDLELSVCAIVRLLVRAPSAKLRGVPEAAALHVVVCDFNHQLGTQRFPREILALAPAALSSRHALRDFAGPMFPGVTGERIVAVGSKEFRKLPALRL